MKAISLSAKAESFQITINWKAIATIVSALARKSLTLITSIRFALVVASVASVIGFYATIFSDTVFLASIIVATIALARVIFPMVKGGAE